MPQVVVITPEHTGITGTRQPELYWYLSKATRTRFKFALVNDLEVEPILIFTSESDLPAGYNYIDLADHGITLAPGIFYQWSVALVQDPAKPSTDIVSSGRIEYVEPPVELQAQLETATPLEAVYILAKAGYWYDTFAQLSGLIAADPGNPVLLEDRAALLEQVGLAGLSGSHANRLGAGNAE